MIKKNIFILLLLAEMTITVLAAAPNNRPGNNSSGIVITSKALTINGYTMNRYYPFDTCYFFGWGQGKLTEIKNNNQVRECVNKQIKIRWPVIYYASWDNGTKKELDTICGGIDSTAINDTLSPAVALTNCIVNKIETKDVSWLRKNGLLLVNNTLYFSSIDKNQLKSDTIFFHRQKIKKKTVVSFFRYDSTKHKLYLYSALDNKVYNSSTWQLKDSVLTQHITGVNKHFFCSAAHSLNNLFKIKKDNIFPGEDGWIPFLKSMGISKQNCPDVYDLFVASNRKDPTTLDYYLRNSNLDCLPSVVIQKILEKTKYDTLYYDPLKQALYFNPVSVNSEEVWVLNKNNINKLGKADHRKSKIIEHVNKLMLFFKHNSLIIMVNSIIFIFLLLYLWWKKGKRTYLNVRNEMGQRFSFDSNETYGILQLIEKVKKSQRDDNKTSDSLKKLIPLKNFLKGKKANREKVLEGLLILLVHVNKYLSDTENSVIDKFDDPRYSNLLKGVIKSMKVERFVPEQQKNS